MVGFGDSVFNLDPIILHTIIFYILNNSGTLKSAGVVGKKWSFFGTSYTIFEALLMDEPSSELIKL